MREIISYFVMIILMFEHLKYIVKNIMNIYGLLNTLIYWNMFMKLT